MSKWIDAVLKDEPNASVEVLGFIENFLGNDPEQAEVIRHKFRAGYCWHFAHMLQATFGFGTCCLTFPFGHFVWFGKDWIPYDIEGVYEGEADYFIPEHLMQEDLADFKRIPGKYIDKPEDVIKRSLDVINRVCRYSSFDACAWMCNMSERDKEYMREHYSELYNKLQLGDFYANYDACRDLACQIPVNYMFGVAGWSRAHYTKYLNKGGAKL